MLAHWQVTDVRTVPDVMYQVRCGYDERDRSIEYQFNWFVDCTETFIHNHRHSFDSYCLEGEYIEKLWEIVDDDKNDITYQFRRNSDTTFDLYKTITGGTLRHVKSRYHFPGNRLHVDTCQFHSISPIVNSTSRVLTFLVKQNYSPERDMFVLSLSPQMKATNNNEIRVSTNDERQAMYEKLQQVISSGINMCDD